VRSGPVSVPVPDHSSTGFAPSRDRTVSDVVRTMEEFHRLVRPGGLITVVTRTTPISRVFCDPTHRWHLNSFLRPAISRNHGGFGYYSARRLRGIRAVCRLLAFGGGLGFDMLVNRFPRFRRFWEH